ncbi:MAG: FKBP-type peptidylprolyl isomerase [Flavobacterium sp.]|nr:FKBP-type peptidylprolyl isomerase [Flavobacterium sp.]MBP8157261.1 FKBP-type peptidylprolyl isomerase [Flavobacterium sp.]
MNNFFKVVFFFLVSTLIVSCSKNDSNSTTPKRDYAEQFATDLANTEEFLQTHYMVVTDNPGATDDQNVTFVEIPEGGTQTSVWNQTDYPLQTHYVAQDDITYKIYYIQLRQGTGSNSKSPCNVDRVLASYNGRYIYTKKETVNEVEVEKISFEQFEESITPESYFTLSSVIKGWSEIFPKFKTGSYSANPDGTLSYSNFGAGVMFIPSGLAYYNASSGIIPAYSPLIFSFKLYEIQRVDNDNDGVPSYLEDISTSIVNPDGTLTTINGVSDGYLRVLEEGIVNPDDTDGDETPDFLDIDDDGDFFTTASEINNLLTDDPYPFDDIPLCSDGKKRHVSNVCHH